MTIDRRSFLRALGITPAAIVAAKYIPEAMPVAVAEPRAAAVPQYVPSPELLYEGRPIPHDAVILRMDEVDYHALSIDMEIHADQIDVTSFYDSTREYCPRVPERREVAIKCAGIHRFEQFEYDAKVSCSILLRNGAAIDFAGRIVGHDMQFNPGPLMSGNRTDFTRLRISVDGEVTLRRC